MLHWLPMGLRILTWTGPNSCILEEILILWPSCGLKRKASSEKEGWCWVMGLAPLKSFIDSVTVTVTHRRHMEYGNSRARDRFWAATVTYASAEATQGSLTCCTIVGTPLCYNFFSSFIILYIREGCICNYLKGMLLFVLCLKLNVFFYSPTEILIIIWP